MKTGLAKQFKQVLDTQVKRAKAVERVAPDEAEEPERGGKRRPPEPRHKG